MLRRIQIRRSHRLLILRAMHTKQEILQERCLLPCSQSLSSKSFSSESEEILLTIFSVTTQHPCAYGQQLVGTPINSAAEAYMIRGVVSDGRQGDTKASTRNVTREFRLMAPNKVVLAAALRLGRLSLRSSRPKPRR